MTEALPFFYFCTVAEFGGKTAAKYFTSRRNIFNANLCVQLLSHKASRRLSQGKISSHKNLPSMSQPAQFSPGPTFHAKTSTAIGLLNASLNTDLSAASARHSKLNSYKRVQ